MTKGREGNPEKYSRHSFEQIGVWRDLGADEKKPSMSEEKFSAGKMSAGKRYLIILVVVQVGLGLAYLKTVPRIYGDEAWDASLGYNLAQEGSLRHPFIEGFGGMDIHFIQPRVVVPLVCAAIFKVADYSIFNSRVGSVFFGVLAVVSLWGVMRRWFGEKQALWMAAATVAHPWFFEVSRRARPEIYYTALALLALWCAVYSLEHKSVRMAVLAGVSGCLSGLAHPSGFILSFVIATAFLVWLGTRGSRRLVLWAAVGFAVTILPYLVYVLRSVQDPGVHFFEQMHSGTGARAGAVAGEIGRWKHFLQWPKGGPLGLIILMSVFLGWYRSSREDKAVATIVILYSAALAFASSNTAGRYLAALVPFLSVLMVRLVWRLATGVGVPFQRWRIVRLCCGSCIVIVYALICAAGISILFYRLRGADFTKVTERVASVVDEEDRVYAFEVFWIGHKHYRYGPYPMDFSVIPWRQTIEMVGKHKFDYAVRTAWSLHRSYGIAEPPMKMPDLGSSTMDQVCKRFGTKVDEFRDSYFGPVEIYKLDWSCSGVQ